MKNKYKYTDSIYYSLDRDEYYERLMFPSSPSFLNQVFQSKNSALLSNLPVVFRELQFGDNPKIASDKFGTPSYVIENQGASSQILFYKEKINNQNVITQLHFLSP